MIVIAVALTPQLPAQERSAPRSGPGTGNPDEHRVPWKFLQTDEILHEKPVTLYWIPASLEQAEKSPMMTSRFLLDASERCVDLEIILPERAAKLTNFGVPAKGPAAFVVDQQGHVTRESGNGRELTIKDVEPLLNAELKPRDEAMYRAMSEAAQQAKAGNKDAAIDLYKKVWNDRCLFSVAGAEAQRALKQLGVIVKETPVPPPPDPNLKPSMTTPPHS